MISSIRWAAAPALVCVLVLGLAACGDGGGTTEPSPCVALGLDVVPRDTAVYVDGGFDLSVLTFAPCGPTVTYEVEHGIATVDAATGRVSGKAYGHGRIFVRSGVLVDTVTVSVVPRGRLAVSDVRGGIGQPIGVFMINTDLSDRRRLADASSSLNGAMATTWAPSGDAVLYHSISSNTAWWNTFSVDTLGNRRRLTQAGLELEEAWPTPSADGWIYYTQRFTNSGSQALMRMPLAGGTPQTIRPADPYSDAGRPDPSPDGRVLAYQGWTTGLPVPQPEIRFLDLQTRTDLAPRVIGSAPSYSHGGTRLAFAREDAILVADADGTGARVVTPAANLYREWASWSPGDGWLAVYAWAPGRIELIHLATGLVVPLPGTAGLTHPSWHPSSRD